MKKGGLFRKVDIREVLRVPLALTGFVPGLGCWPKRVPCVPQMGAANMKGHQVQMAHSAYAELRH